MDTRYRVVLTGELIEGYELGSTVQELAAFLKQPPEKVRLVFNRRPTPLNRLLDYRSARNVQQRLETMGVRSKVEALENRAPAAFTAAEISTAAPPAGDGHTMTCPKCGSHQPQALACRECGVVVSKYRADGAAPSTPAVAPRGRAAPADPQERLLLFIGPRAERYAKKFARFKEGKFAPGWNWAAFFGGAVWPAYRKLWLWVAFQLGLIPLSYYLPALSTILWLAFVVSADYLYFRHVQRRLKQLEGKSDEAVTLAGGTSLAVAGVVTVMPAVVLVVVALAMGFVQLPLGNGSQMSAAELLMQDPQIASITGKSHGQTTIAAFTVTAQAVEAWREEGRDMNALSTRVLLRDSELSEKDLTDGWGGLLMVVPESSGGFIVISSGPDGLYDSDDDIPIIFPAN